MRFVRVRRPDGAVVEAVLIDDRTAAPLPSEGRVELGAGLDRERLQELGRRAIAAGESFDVDPLDLAAPLQAGKIVCIGANYARHVAESNVPMPTEPIIFLKTPDTVVGPNDPITVPPGSTKTDWEVEFGVVIGRTASHLGRDAAVVDHIAGYVLANDVSERAFQLERGGTWDKGKNCPTFCPLGPWFVTADEIADPQQVRLGLDLNGERQQASTTGDMIFAIDHLLRYTSRFLTLYPGDVLLTGTPEGVGMGQQPQRFLTEGDQLRTWADGLGEQASTVLQG